MLMRNIIQQHREQNDVELIGENRDRIVVSNQTPIEIDAIQFFFLLLRFISIWKINLTECKIAHYPNDQAK